MLFSPTCHGEGGAVSSPARALPHSEVLGQTETLLEQLMGDRGSALFAVTACPSTGRGHQALQLWFGGEGVTVDRGAPLSPHPRAGSTALCLAVVCPGVLSSFPLCQQGSDLEGQAGHSRSPSPAALCSALSTILTLQSAASATLDSHFQGWVLLLLTGAQAGKNH